VTAAVVLCDRHTGEAHAPRCGACESLNAEYSALGIVAMQPNASEGTRTMPTPDTTATDDQVTEYLRAELTDALTRRVIAERKYNDFMSEIAQAVVRELRSSGYIEVHDTNPNKER
jgi:hypothetical protein